MLVLLMSIFLSNEMVTELILNEVRDNELIFEGDTEF